MARDHALALCLPNTHAVLRLYRWSKPTISFGRHEPAEDLFDTGAALAQGIGFVRRPTGGRAVLHDHELTYSVAIPAGAYGSARQTYERVGLALIGGLKGLGVSAVAHEGGVALPPSAGPCFAAPSEGELVVSGRKLIGSAQAKIGRVLLQHGSLLISGDQARLDRLKLSSTKDVSHHHTLRSLLGDAPELSSVENALLDGFQEAFQGTWEESALSEEESCQQNRLLSQYESDEWTWRL